MTTYKKVELGVVGKWGVRGIVQGYRCLAEVPLPPKGITATIEERRRARDIMAQYIVDALNEKGERLDAIFVDPPAVIPMKVKDE